MTPKLWGTSPNNPDRIRLHEFAKKTKEERAKIIKNLHDVGEFRCFNCGRPLLTGKLGSESNVQVECRDSRCKHLNVISTT